MSKYIDAEKIIAFLENEKAENIIGGDYSDGVLDTCDNILAFIDSLQQEQPSEELEEAAARYERENRQGVLSSVDIVNAFIEGAKWKEERR